MKPEKIAQDVVDYLIEEGEGSAVPQVSAVLSQLASEMDHEKETIVTTAISLSDKEKERLRDVLQKIFNKSSISIENEVDKNVIGGIKIQIGDIVIDATVKAQIERVKMDLLA